jgi:hypothetical protein
VIIVRRRCRGTIPAVCAAAAPGDLRRVTERSSIVNGAPRARGRAFHALHGDEVHGSPLAEAARSMS